MGQRHHLKGEKEQLFGEVLNGLDLHRPPCSALRANQVYYLIAALAYDKAADWEDRIGVFVVAFGS